MQTTVYLSSMAKFIVRVFSRVDLSHHTGHTYVLHDG